MCSSQSPSHNEDQPDTCFRDILRTAIRGAIKEQQEKKRSRPIRKEAQIISDNCACQSKVTQCPGTHSSVCSSAAENQCLQDAQGQSSTARKEIVKDSQNSVRKDLYGNHKRKKGIDNEELNGTKKLKISNKTDEQELTQKTMDI